MIKFLIVMGIIFIGVLCGAGIAAVVLYTYYTWGERQCRCRGHYERTGKHVEDCPMYKKRIPFDPWKDWFK